MVKYSYVVVMAVILVMMLAASVLANGAVPKKGAGPTMQPVQPAPVQPVQPCQPAQPAGPGAGPLPTGTQGAQGQVCYQMSQLVTLTVAQTWDLTGRNYTGMTTIMQAMADMSARKRGVSIPDSIAAGTEIGQMIRQRCEADPNQLLYSVVDSSVRDYAARHR